MTGRRKKKNANQNSSAIFQKLVPLIWEIVEEWEVKQSWVIHLKQHFTTPFKIFLRESDFLNGNVKHISHKSAPTLNSTDSWVARSHPLRAESILHDKLCLPHLFCTLSSHLVSDLAKLEHLQKVTVTALSNALRFQSQSLLFSFLYSAWQVSRADRLENFQRKLKYSSYFVKLCR